MKIAFSTLACPDYDWNDIVSIAKDTGFDGIEVRGVGKDIIATKARIFANGRREETKKRLDALRLEIPCFSTGCCLKFADKREENKRDITEYIILAHKMGTPYIRI